jgi:putative flippase GtrA
VAKFIKNLRKNKYYIDLVKKYPFTPQVIKFVIAGFTNFFTYIISLNILCYLFGIYKGWQVFFPAAIAFSIAAIQSYFLNSKWTFKGKKEIKGQKKEFTQFLIITIIGQGINSSIVFLVTTFIPPVFDLSQEIWLTFGGMCGTAIGLVWNFIGYKFFVFK